MKKKTIKYDNGDKYVGEIKEGKFRGQGILYYANGERQEGEWTEGIKTRKGVLYSSLGTKIIETDCFMEHKWTLISLLKFHRLPHPQSFYILIQIYIVVH